MSVFVGAVTVPPGMDHVTVFLPGDDGGWHRLNETGQSKGFSGADEMPRLALRYNVRWPCKEPGPVEKL